MVTPRVGWFSIDLWAFGKMDESGSFEASKLQVTSVVFPPGAVMSCKIFGTSQKHSSFVATNHLSPQYFNGETCTCKTVQQVTN